MNDKKECILCKDYGMVRTEDIESGGWEICPICYPENKEKTSFLTFIKNWFLNIISNSRL